MRGRRKKSLVHTVCACSVFPEFLGIWKFPVNLLRYTNLSEAHRLLLYKDACHWLRSVWTMTRERRRYSALRLQELSTHSSTPAKCFGTWLTQFFPLKFTDPLEWSNADCYRQSDLVFYFKIVHLCPTESITMQCGLQQVRRNWR